jgi:transcriptional regulator with XRE-family HTH domain
VQLTFKKMKRKSLDTLLKGIGEALSQLRIKKGYTTIKDFAAHYDLSLVQYWRIEKGKANVTVKTLNKLLAIHRMTLTDFFCLLPS